MYILNFVEFIKYSCRYFSACSEVSVMKRLKLIFVLIWKILKKYIYYFMLLILFYFLLSLIHSTYSIVDISELDLSSSDIYVINYKLKDEYSQNYIGKAYTVDESDKSYLLMFIEKLDVITKNGYISFGYVDPASTGLFPDQIILFYCDMRFHIYFTDIDDKILYVVTYKNDNGMYVYKESAYYKSSLLKSNDFLEWFNQLDGKPANFERNEIK